MTVNTAMLGVNRLLPFLGKCELRFLGLTSFKVLKNYPLQAMESHFFRIGLLRVLEKLRRLVYRFEAMVSIQAFSFLLTSLISLIFDYVYFSLELLTLRKKVTYIDRIGGYLAILFFVNNSRLCMF